MDLGGCTVESIVDKLMDKFMNGSPIRVSIFYQGLVLKSQNLSKLFNDLEPSVDQENDKSMNNNFILWVIQPGGAHDTNNKYP